MGQKRHRNRRRVINERRTNFEKLAILFLCEYIHFMFGFFENKINSMMYRHLDIKFIEYDTRQEMKCSRSQ